MVAARIALVQRAIAALLFAGATFGAGVAAAQGSPPVTTTAGVVAGSANDGVAVFRGLPFAAAPVGELRWRPPQPATA